MDTNINLDKIDFKTFFSDVEKYYGDQKKKVIDKIFKQNGNYKYDFDNDTMTIYEDGKLVAKVEYSIVGVYNLNNFVWYWGWNLIFSEKNLTNNSKLIKELGKQIKNKFPKDLSVAKDLEELYFYATNGNFYAPPETIPKLIKIMMYLLKGIWFIGINKKTGTDSSRNTKITQYIIIENIKQYG